jgi:hypothetical protein
MALVLDRNQGGAAGVLVRPIGRMPRGLEAQHHVAAQSVDGRKEERLGGLLVRGALIPGITVCSTEHTFE